MIKRLGASARRRLPFLALAVAIGAIVGGLYAHFIGCSAGTCPITSSVPTASLYGALIGLVLGWPERRRDRADTPGQTEGHPAQQRAPTPPQG